MKTKHFTFLFLCISIFTYGQYTIKGTIEPFDKGIKWAILYQVQEGRQLYVKNSKIVGNSFQFELGENKAVGMYRVVYRLEDNGYLDFLFNKENISFTFDPDYAEETVVFQDSKENKMYNLYMQNIAGAQQYIDSLQVSYFKNPAPVSKNLYREAYFELKDIQKEFEGTTKNMLVYHFIKATQRYNAPKIISSPQAYLDAIKANFFEHIDFNNEILIQSSFLVDRVIDYIFNLNYSQDSKIQEKLYKESIQNVFEIPMKEEFRKSLMEIIINEFVKYEDIEIVKYLFEDYYDKLPQALQRTNFKIETLAKLQVVVGAIAPDFSWDDAKKLSKLNTHKNYIIVFWSTGCSHCKKQLPELYTYLKDVKNIQVIAVALEKDAADWNLLKPNMMGWEHVLGLGKWNNTIARSYNVESTPTYILLNANKRILALPKNYKELKEAVSKLK